ARPAPRSRRGFRRDETRDAPAGRDRRRRGDRPRADRPRGSPRARGDQGPALLARALPAPRRAAAERREGAVPADLAGAPARRALVEPARRGAPGPARTRRLSRARPGAPPPRREPGGCRDVDARRLPDARPRADAAPLRARPD